MAVVTVQITGVNQDLVTYKFLVREETLNVKEISTFKTDEGNG